MQQQAPWRAPERTRMLKGLLLLLPARGMVAHVEVGGGGWEARPTKRKRARPTRLLPSSSL